MAVPKKKTSHQKQHQRRAHWKASAQTIGTCANCGAPKRSHTACGSCGYYRGRPARLRDAVV
ncbi:50S ribosomal protein L32 [soil metagenome]|jgi:large subunit ribosomal protein L32|nr:50S ribosomal protein L32 [Candidatus Melainabacteria bacterium]